MYVVCGPGYAGNERGEQEPDTGDASDECEESTMGKKQIEQHARHND